MQNSNDGFDDKWRDRSSGYSSRRRRRSGPTPRQIAIPVVVLLVLVAGWFVVRSGPQPDEAPASPLSTLPDATVDEREELEDVPPLDLPDLDASDAFVRGLVRALSSRPQLAGWLVSDELVHRFVVSVVNLSAGMSPRSELGDLAPDGEFAIVESGSREVVDPASYRRYDAFAETFASLDTRGTARLYRQLHPLFIEAHRTLGIPQPSFDEAFAQAIRNLLAVEVTDARHEVVLNEDGVYVYVDPRMEARTPAEKHLHRMGPENARLFQLKLAELAPAMGVRVPPRP